MKDKEKRERSKDKNVTAIRITKRDSENIKPFVFVSYASDDWRMVLHEIVYRLNQVYGLRVYFDREFDINNENWTTQFPYNMRSPFCKAILVFYSDSYRRRYATLMELMCSKTKIVKDIPLIPVNLGRLKQLTDYEQEVVTGLGKEEWNDNTNNHAEEELELFHQFYDELKESAKYSRIKPFYDKRYSDFRVGQCSDMIGELYKASNVNDNNIAILREDDDLNAKEYQKYLESDTYQKALNDAKYQEYLDERCRVIAENIHNTKDNNKKVIQVFDEEKYQKAMNQKETAAEKAETEKAPAADKSTRADGSTSAQHTASAEPEKTLTDAAAKQREPSVTPDKTHVSVAAEQGESSAAPEEILTFREAKAVRTKNGIRILKESIVNKKINEKTIRKEAKKKRLRVEADGKFRKVRGKELYQLDEDVVFDSEDDAISFVTGYQKLPTDEWVSQGGTETDPVNRPEKEQEKAQEKVSEKAAEKVSDKAAAGPGKLPGVAWYHCTSRGANGIIAEINDEKYMVLRGSRRAPEAAASYQERLRLRDFLQENVKEDLFLKDSEELAVSSAAAILSLQSTNGKQETSKEVREEDAIRILSENLGAEIPRINAGFQAEQASAPSEKTKAGGNSGAFATLPGVAWFHCKARGANGVLAKTEDNQYLVLRGSCRAPEPAPRYEPSKLMKEFEEKVLHDIFTVDTTPTSLTGAARMLSLKFTTDGKQETQNQITMEEAQKILRENLEKVKAPVTIPELPSEDLKVGEFVKTAMDNLQKSGYEFSKEQLDELTDLERSKKIFGLKSGITFLKKYDRKEDKPHCDNTGRPRYYSPDSRGNKDGFVLKFGGEEYLLTSQWYDGQQAAFREWYKSLGKH